MAEGVTVDGFRAFENHSAANEDFFTDPGNESLVWTRGRIPDEELGLATGDSKGHTSLRLDTRLNALWEEISASCVLGVGRLVQ